MSYSIESITADCYPGSAVLINLLDIRDADRLAEAENMATAVRAAEWLNKPLCNSYDFGHYKRIHAYLFGDLYTWAGQVRTVDIAKKTTRFCHVDEIQRCADAIFSKIQHLKLCELSRERFVDEILDLYVTTNTLHPFREGNGRTQRVFLTQLVRESGHDIRFDLADPDELMIATIRSAEGVNDILRALLDDIIN